MLLPLSLSPKTPSCGKQAPSPPAPLPLIARTLARGSDLQEPRTRFCRRPAIPTKQRELSFPATQKKKPKKTRTTRLLSLRAPARAPYPPPTPQFPSWMKIPGHARTSRHFLSAAPPAKQPAPRLAKESKTQKLRSCRGSKAAAAPPRRRPSRPVLS